MKNLMDKLITKATEEIVDASFNVGEKSSSKCTYILTYEVKFPEELDVEEDDNF